MSSYPPSSSNNDLLRQFLTERDPRFFEQLRIRTASCVNFSDLIALSTHRKRAEKVQFSPVRDRKTLRVAMIGGCSLYPLSDLVQHCLETLGQPDGLRVELFSGAYDNYVSEIMAEESPLYEFKPDLLFLIPSERRCKYPGSLFDTYEDQKASAQKTASDLLMLCRCAQERSRAEVIVANFALPPGYDPGPYRGRTASSDWTYRKLVNLELGAMAPSSIQICDIEFLSSRCGALTAADPRGWFESKQPYSPDFLVTVAREVAHIHQSLRRGHKKVLVLDLDNTLWGGVVGDDGLEGIEIGDTSPRGEAFKAFQAYIQTLSARGILLAVCSKNDHGKAAEPFEKHPEMVLRLKDFVSFKANWDPKSDNLRQIAKELNLGLDSFVFVDDNPAEIEIVNQFAPEVATVLLSADPSEYVRQLQDARFFEVLNVTSEDAQRVRQYQVEAEREQLLVSSTDMTSYLRSLEMKGVVAEFQGVDVPRIAQLINKSNQFNVTTRRRSEQEVRAVIADPNCRSFTVRLADKFGDHGLISVVICKVAGTALEIDTWLMSCRVLKRQVEEEVLNEICRLAREAGCDRLAGKYIPTAKNGMVSDLYPRMGFRLVRTGAQNESEYELLVAGFRPAETAIEVTRRTNDQRTSVGAAPDRV